MEYSEKYINILKTVNRDGIDELVDYLVNKTDFFTAPASTNYHGNSKGGLCVHSLNVYENMEKLANIFCPELDKDTIKIVSLLHDLSKVDFYEQYGQNKKEYSATGSKRDELGNFDWVSTVGYRIKDQMARDLVIGEHGFNSYYLISKFIKLKDDEVAAILNHHCGMDNGYVFRDLNEVMNRFPALTLLHMADLSAVYFQENPYLVENE